MPTDGVRNEMVARAAYYALTEKIAEAIRNADRAIASGNESYQIAALRDVADKASALSMATGLLANWVERYGPVVVVGGQAQSASPEIKQEVK